MAIYCTDVETLSPAYLDGELGGTEHDELEHHLGACATCRARLEDERAALARLRAALRPPAAPASLARDVGRLLDREDHAATRRPWGRALPAIASLAAAAALVVFALDATRGTPASPALAPLNVATVERDAVASRLQAGPLMPVASQSEAARSVADYLRVPVNAPRFASAASLRGWQPTRIAGRPSARLVYDVSTPGGARYRVDVHMLDGRDVALAGTEHVVADGIDLWVSRRLGINTVVYKDIAGVGYVVTSDMPRGQVIDLVLTSELLPNATQRVFGD